MMIVENVNNLECRGFGDIFLFLIQQKSGMWRLILETVERVLVSVALSFRALFWGSRNMAAWFCVIHFCTCRPYPPSSPWWKTHRKMLMRTEVGLKKGFHQKCNATKSNWAPCVAFFSVLKIVNMLIKLVQKKLFWLWICYRGPPSLGTWGGGVFTNSSSCMIQGHYFLCLPCYAMEPMEQTTWITFLCKLPHKEHMRLWIFYILKLPLLSIFDWPGQVAHSHTGMVHWVHIVLGALCLCACATLLSCVQLSSPNHVYRGL